MFISSALGWLAGGSALMAVFGCRPSDFRATLNFRDVSTPNFELLPSEGGVGAMARSFPLALNSRPSADKEDADTGV